MNTKDGNGVTSNETLLTNNKEVCVNNEQTINGVRNFDSLATGLKAYLEDLHKYQCGSDEHRADFDKDMGLDPIPHQDTVGAIYHVPEGLSDDKRKQWYAKENERRGITPEMEKEWHEACWKHADAEMEHNWECYSGIAFSILGILESSTCEHCGDTHTGLGRDTDGTAFEYDGVLMNLFEVIAFELMNRGEKYKYAQYKKSDLLQAVMRLNPEVATKEVA